MHNGHKHREEPEDSDVNQKTMWTRRQRYHKNPNNSDTQIIAAIMLKFEQCGFIRSDLGLRYAQICLLNALEASLWPSS